MPYSSLPSMRIILFSILAPGTIQTLIEKLEALNQQVPLLVTLPGASSYAPGQHAGITTRAYQFTDVLITNNMHRLPGILKEFTPDVILAFGFPRKFPPSLLTLPRLGCVNWHPSLLPCYRGPEPLFWQLMNGETHVGVTFHRMDKDINTGPILVQREIDIDLDDITSASHFCSKFLTPTYEAIPEVLQAIASETPGAAQSSPGVSYAPPVTDAEYWLDWSRPAVQLHNRIRAWSLNGGVRVEIEGQSLLIAKAQVVKPSSPSLRIRPGSILERSSEGIVVQTGQGALLIKEYTPGM